MNLWRYVPAEALAKLVEVGIDLPGPACGEHNEGKARVGLRQYATDWWLDHREGVLLRL